MSDEFILNIGMVVWIAVAILVTSILINIAKQQSKYKRTFIFLAYSFMITFVLFGFTTFFGYSF